MARTLSWGLFSAAIAAFAVACGPTVLVEGDPDGTGGAAGGVPISPTTTPTTPVPPTGCVAECSIPPNGKDTCACDFSCASYPGNVKSECEPNVDLQGNLKTKCICTVSVGFTGVCFETNPANLCDWTLGCCGKYAGK